MDITGFFRTALPRFLLLLALASCAAAPSQPQGPTPEELQRQAERAELERLRAAERERLAKEEAERKAAEEAQRQKEAQALPPEFGKAQPPTVAALPPPPAAPDSTGAPSAAAAAPAMPPLIASSAAAVAEAPTVPYDQAFPPIPDRLLRVAVVSAPSQANVAERIGTMLMVTERERLERALGMGLRIAYLSQSDRDPKARTRIQYREKYMQAAVKLAGVIPQAQHVERMSEAEANRMGVDVLIQVGADLH